MLWEGADEPLFWKKMEVALDMCWLPLFHFPMMAPPLYALSLREAQNSVNDRAGRGGNFNIA